MVFSNWRKFTLRNSQGRDLSDLPNALMERRVLRTGLFSSSNASRTLTRLKTEIFLDQFRYSEQWKQRLAKAQCPHQEDLRGRRHVGLYLLVSKETPQKEILSALFNETTALKIARALASSKHPYPGLAAHPFEHVKYEIQKFIDPVGDPEGATRDSSLWLVVTNCKDDRSGDP